MTSHVPAQTFILVSLGSLLVLMVGWRVAFVYVFANGGNTVQTKPANRSGGVFEFLEVWLSIMSTQFSTFSDLISMLLILPYSWILEKSVLLFKFVQF